jgi:arsenate reductase
MAEALINHELGETWHAFSAGTRPSGVVHPLAIQALAELGIQHQGVSKSTEDLRGQVFDVVITGCDDAAENCPVWLGKSRRMHIGFPDPALAEGSPEERLAVFWQVRDAIHAKILPYLRSLSETL